MLPTVEFSRIGFPGLPAAETILSIPVARYDSRIAALTAAIDADWIVVYGDPEHPANIMRLTGHDPRFEEALLVLGRGRRSLIVGSEGMGHARGAVAAVDLIEVPSFSLPWINRNAGKNTLAEGLAQAGLSRGDSVAVIGWKPVEPGEAAFDGPALWVPAFITASIAHVVGTGRITDATPVVMRTDGGQRWIHDADQIAFFEWAGSRASVCSTNVMRAARPGRWEPEVMGDAGYRGEQTLYRPILTSGPNAKQGLKSPVSRQLELGDAIFTTWGFWGGNCGRGGIVAASEADLRPDSAGFLDRVAGPYFAVLAKWYSRLRLGAIGGEMHRATVADCVAGGFAPLLNTSHLQDWEDWPTTMFHDRDTTLVRSGMVIAADIFSAANGPAGMCHCEDTVAIANTDLRAEIAERHPEVYARMQARRLFMRDRLGIDLGEEVLPFSTVPAYHAPLWMDRDMAYRLA